MQTVIALIIILICTVRTISYGVYTVKDKNKTGGVGLFVMAFLTALCSVYFFIR